MNDIRCANPRACPSHKTCGRARKMTYGMSCYADFKPMPGTKRCGNWLKKSEYQRERKPRKDEE